MPRLRATGGSREPGRVAARRWADAIIALVGLVALVPLFVLVATWIRLDSPGPVFFRQARVGWRFQPFRIWKFRTMVHDAAGRGPGITIGNDVRITRAGRFLRRTKLDELPQLINVLVGEMSLVGPRPELPRYVKIFLPEYRDLLTVRPGVTDLACLAYMNEAAVLALSGNPEVEYVSSTLPRKLQLSRQGLQRSSWAFDLRVILATVAGIGRRSLLSSAGHLPAR
jgi:lipopolysaccharide/colanic/teichoic acid biosynthesis glycosyltransferase